MFDYRVEGTVELFEMKGGWFYIRIPKEISLELEYRAVRGLIPIEAHIGNTTWLTSLLPMGDGTHFVALKAQVRKREGLAQGTVTEVEFSVR